MTCFYHLAANTRDSSNVASDVASLSLSMSPTLSLSFVLINSVKVTFPLVRQQVSFLGSGQAITHCHNEYLQEVPIGARLMILIAYSASSLYLWMQIKVQWWKVQQQSSCVTPTEGCCHSDSYCYTVHWFPDCLKCVR